MTKDKLGSIHRSWSDDVGDGSNCDVDQSNGSMRGDGMLAKTNLDVVGLWDLSPSQRRPSRQSTLNLMDDLWEFRLI